MYRWVGLLLLVGLTGCGSETPAGPSSLIVVDLVLGTGATAASGDNLTVNYVGTLLDGIKFDSSYDRGQPFDFKLGVGAVIAGWDQGIPGMMVGVKRRVTIPPALGYGSRT